MAAAHLSPADSREADRLAIASTVLGRAARALAIEPLRGPERPVAIELMPATG